MTDGTRKEWNRNARNKNDEFINFADAFGTGMCEVVVAYPGTTSVDNYANRRNSIGTFYPILQ